MTALWAPLRFVAGATPFLLSIACDGTEGTLVVRGSELSEDGGARGTGGGPPSPPGPPAAGRSPSPGVTWQAQLSGGVDPTLDVDLFYLDPDFTSADALGAVRSRGRIVLCYVSAGTFEPWRDDANDFPGDTLGEPLAEYPREQWLDVRDPRVRELMRARLDRMREAGCDGIYPSTLEAHLAPSGFSIGRADVAEYAGWFAAEIHARGLSAGLSAPADLIPDVEGSYDWALAIDCLPASGCAPWAPFRESGRAVLLVEFGDAAAAPGICDAARALGFDAIVKRPAFDAFRIGCDEVSP